MSSLFADATAVTPVGEGRFSTTIAEGWDIAGNANGGYLLAIAGRALRDASGRSDPVTVTAHYLAPGKPGPATIDTAIVKSGKRFTTGTALLVKDQKPLLSVLGTFGDLAPTAGVELLGGGPPELPEPERCVPMMSRQPFPPSFKSKVELRLHPDDAHFVTGEPSGTPRVRGWFRLRDGEPVDTVALLLAVDAFPPTVFNARLPIAWTPTVELTAHVRARPAPGWLACAFATRFVAGGFLEADGEVWDSTSTLVAQSRQLALVPRPA